MLTSSFQTVIKRYNSNSQEIKIKLKKKRKKLIWHSRAKFILMLVLFAPKTILDSPEKKSIYGLSHNWKRETIAFWLGYFPPLRYKIYI